jgi:hypothetical protein
VPRSDRFPRTEARDLEGRDVVLPDAFDGDRNVVIVAFRREHQGLVDSWIPWLEERAAHDPGLRFYELPTIARLWAPMRGFIDGGMATAIKDPTVLRRTLTVYGDRTRLTDPLGIGDRSSSSTPTARCAGPAPVASSRPPSTAWTRPCARPERRRGRPPVDGWEASGPAAGA